MGNNCVSIRLNTGRYERKVKFQKGFLSYFFPVPNRHGLALEIGEGRGSKVQLKEEEKREDRE